MRRQVALLLHALGALRRRAGRGAAVTAGLAFLVAMLSSVLFLTDALRREHAAGSDALPDLTVQRMVAGRPALIEPSLVAAIERMPGVRSVTPRVWGYHYVPPLSANVTVVAAPAEGGEEAFGLSLGAGSGPREPGDAVVGEVLARHLGLRVGDEVALTGPAGPLVFRITGTFRTDSALQTADVIVLRPDDARALLGVPDGLVTDLAISLTTPDEAAALATHVGGLFEGARVLDKQRLRRTYELTFDARAGLLSVVLLPALAAFLLLAWDRLTGLGEAERQEIGVLKAVGWETSDVLAARLWESGLVAVAGSVLGLGLGYLYVFWAEAPGLAGALLGWSNLYPPLELTPAVDASQLASILGSVVVPFVAVSLVPAWRAATVDPDRAMRGAG